MTMRKAAIWTAAWATCALSTFTASDVAGAAEGPDAQALLHRALPAATDTEIDGVSWHCKAEKCTGTVVRRQSRGSRLEECRRVATVLGKLASYSSRGKEMSSRDLENCNRGAR
jgi:hypothetical protein